MAGRSSTTLQTVDSTALAAVGTRLLDSDTFSKDDKRFCAPANGKFDGSMIKMNFLIFLLNWSL